MQCVLEKLKIIFMKSNLNLEFHALVICQQILIVETVLKMLKNNNNCKIRRIISVVIYLFKQKTVYHIKIQKQEAKS